MATTTRKKGNTGKRYSDVQKQKILAFVNGQGRGGISAAGKKFGVSYIALRRWMNGETGGNKAGRPPSKGLDGRKLKSVTAAMASLKSFKKHIFIMSNSNRSHNDNFNQGLAIPCNSILVQQTLVNALPP